MAAANSTSALESEIYWSIKNEVLIELRDLLVDKLQVEKIITYLRSKRVLDKVDAENINAEKTETKRREKFLDILSDKGPSGFDQFCHAIREKGVGQQYLLDIILTTFDKKKQERSKFINIYFRTITSIFRIHVGKLATITSRFPILITLYEETLKAVARAGGNEELYRFNRVLGKKLYSE